MSESDEQVQTIYCQQCGQQIRADARFCDRCGTEVPGAGGDHAEETTSRRSWLMYGAGAIAGTALLGGGAFVLMDSGPEHRLAGEEAWETIERDSSQVSQSIDGELTLDPGEFVGRLFTPSQSATLGISVTVTSGAPLDVITMERSEFDVYQDNPQEALYLSNLSEIGVSDDIVSGSLTEGDYSVVLDNSGKFGTQPDGELTAEVGMTVRV